MSVSEREGASQCIMWPCQLSKSGTAGQKLKAEITVQNQLLEIQMAYCMARNFVGQFISADWQF